MKRFVLLLVLLAAVIALPASTAVSRPQLMPVLILDATPQSDGNSLGEEAPVPLTDHTPWLVHLILISPAVALAWILFSLARAKMKKNGTLTEPEN